MNTQHNKLLVYFKPMASTPADLSTSGDETINNYKNKYIPPIKILQTKDDMKIRKELLCLRKFLNMDLDRPLKVID
jgi:hypothetical protein